ncbi:hypothetical protein FA09DRAFT_910 [Tilletiopsis washingtonensis]|uniref:Uncharacterized protein n=1 Tax=Tilletiopsis washingtonensis TaxID=58919 RepID=A0A316ZKY9_9BASI|nr:hypothetical protein FA09DRAFT_910 [Tilletiopsis washingtonensis]PWO01056.1 hypothetical protein FA09DRAFT_910 [Tilletiopsis washingtonensis]
MREVCSPAARGDDYEQDRLQVPQHALCSAVPARRCSGQAPGGEANRGASEGIGRRSHEPAGAGCASVRGYGRADLAHRRHSTSLALASSDACTCSRRQPTQASPAIPLASSAGATAMLPRCSTFAARQARSAFARTGTLRIDLRCC